MRQTKGSQPSNISVFRLGNQIASMAASADRRQRYVRVLRASLFMMAVLGVGSYGYYELTGREQSVLECLYMTVITVATVGFAETIVIDTDLLRVFTMGLILFGGGAILYFLTAVTAVVVEGDIVYGLWRRRMNARLKRQRQQVVVAGLGRSGSTALEDLWNARIPVVAIDDADSQLEAAVARFGDDLPFVLGDALEEATLLAAGIENARGLIAALGDDRENLYLCLTARQLNPRMRIVVKVEDNDHAPKFESVGVDQAVNPAGMSARRMAAELMRPELTEFNDALLAAEGAVRIAADIPIDPRSDAAGKTLEDSRLGERTTCIIMGIRPRDSHRYIYHPPETAELVAGGSVMALGERRQVRRLRRLLTGRGRT